MRDLCANCGHWREEHYGKSGAFVAHTKFGCESYEGTEPSPERAAKKTAQLAAVNKSGATSEPDYPGVE